MENYFLAIDQGTTSTRTVLYDSNFTALDQNQIEITQYYPKPGYVEHDAQEIWDKTFLTISSLLEKNGLEASQVISIGITNQRETIVGWDQKTGKPIGNAIVWQDKRTTNYCKTLQNQGVEKEVIEKSLGKFSFSIYFNINFLMCLFPRLSSSISASDFMH